MPTTAHIKIDNATVHASAGSGKTYLLVSRIVQLLLNGAEPGSILAITFTRKAAAEMQQRLLQRLFELAEADDDELSGILHQLDAGTDPTNLQQARHLFEQILTTEHPVTTTTFHAFCQDLLRRFPLEADVPAGFELLEQTGGLQDEAWEGLMAEAATTTDTQLVKALDLLFQQLNLNNTRHALQSFVQQRSDWWAYTEREPQPLEFASQRLADQLAIQTELDPLQALFANEQALEQCRRYLEYVVKNTNQTSQQLADQLAKGLDGLLPDAMRYQMLRDTYLTQKNEPRKLKISKKMQAIYGEQGTETFEQLHASCAALLLATEEQLAARDTWQMTCAWYRGGHHLLHHYQRIKLEHRLLDFTDLEWKAYQLLNHSDNASWVQYKLDNRIRHLLIDEFQDTNPTQWQLVHPLLEEFAGNPESANSVFLVGDAKQSIYRFRRAEPRLFKTASEWLQTHMQAVRLPLNKSWRSSPAIMDFINRLFGSGPLNEQLMEFMPHATEHQTLWGQVNLLPLVKKEAQEDPPPTGLRNPLTTPPHPRDEDEALSEGQRVAETIQQLVEQHTPVGHAETARPIRYNDIMILLRSRTHVAEFEHALRRRGIPYLGAERGTLLEALEVLDMVKLLQWLLSPYDNHALASILRSPLFAAADADLQSLANQGQGNWFERLERLVTELSADSPLRRAHDLLNAWLPLAGYLPVHDLLDRIYSEANVLARYTAAFPESLRGRVSSNLIRFLELALEIDSGRYPSLTRFIKWLADLRQQAGEAPDEPPSQARQERVRLLTVHEAKGLEATVVFLVDTARPIQRKTAYEAMVDWADSTSRPETFLLTGKKDRLDRYSRDKQTQLFSLEDREEANLLYVAVTRAKQLLYISGTAPARSGRSSWYENICRQYSLDEVDTASLCLHETGSPPSLSQQQEARGIDTIEIDPRLRQTLHLTMPCREIAPSRTVSPADDKQALDQDGRQRGLLIHAMLQHLTRRDSRPLSWLAEKFGVAEQGEFFRSCLAESQQVFASPHLQKLFDPQQYQMAYNEIPISYELDGRMVYGVIDRLIVADKQVLLIDYKTHRQAALQMEELVEVYKPQLSLYTQGIKKAWPDFHIAPHLLFTSTGALVPIEL